MSGNKETKDNQTRQSHFGSGPCMFGFRLGHLKEGLCTDMAAGLCGGRKEKERRARQCPWLSAAMVAQPYSFLISAILIHLAGHVDMPPPHSSISALGSASSSPSLLLTSTASW
jgi:hypothetical protein